MLRAFARLSEDGKRIEVLFPYSKIGIRAIKGAGGSWSPSKRLWTVSLDLTSAARLREEFGSGLTLDQPLRVWGRSEQRKQAAKRRMAKAKDAELERVPQLLPELAGLLDARPYQRADIARMALDSVLNANEPGTGKTIEIIGAVAEAGLLDRPVLTIAPVRSIENTWLTELERVGYPHEIIAAEDPQARKRLIAYAHAKAHGHGLIKQEPFWLVINPDLLRVKPAGKKDKVVVRDGVSGDPFTAPAWTAQVLGIPWGFVSIDEFHKFGLTNTRSQFGMAVRLLEAELMCLASGTPFAGKYKRLWALLNWLHPEVYGSWWRWADQWLVQKHNGFGRVVLDEIQPGREEEFQIAHAHHFIRRTKLEELPGCPPKVHRLIECGMTAQQTRQYRAFEQDAELRISGHRVTGHGILAEWSRLRAFANATCRVEEKPSGKLVLHATPDSGKLPYLIDALDECGVRKSQPEPGARAIVGSNDKGFANITAAYLREHGIETALLTGDTKDSRPMIKHFQSDDPKPFVIVMTIQTGGVSLNLERAGSVHALDEAWTPDEMTQFFDRGDRGTRTTPLLCFTYRTKDTIQEYVAEVAAGKEINNQTVLKFDRALRALARTRTAPNSS